MVYLTFDDGPTPAYTPQVLALLARYRARATFFVVGRSAVTWPELVRREFAAGHGVANHTWNHRRPAPGGVGRRPVRLAPARRLGDRRAVLGRVRSGDVVLLHDGGGDRSQTVAALQQVLASLSARGFRFSSLCRG